MVGDWFLTARKSKSKKLIFDILCKSEDFKFYGSHK